jgi:inorganic phosphate transporter, PiT family
MLLFLFLAVLLLGYSNGSNDNFKGTATLWGSGSLGYKPTLVLATIFTFAGSVCSYFFAAELVKHFSGKGLVPDEIIHSADFVLAVALAGGATVLLATRQGFPISTTHSLVGALVGAGLVAVGTKVNFGKLGKTFFLPLLLSPIIAVVVSMLVYALFTRLRKASGITEESCVCVGNKWHPVATLPMQDAVATSRLEASISSKENCQQQYQGNFLGLHFQSVLDKLHILSAAVLSFSRGLNDTPKLVSLLLICNFFELKVNVLILAVLIAAGGVLNGKRIANTMSKKITRMNHGQGFTANLITSVLMITATRLGLPAAITHISVGSIYGVSLVNKTANNKEISKIALSWVLTLPIAGVLSALFYYIIHLINQ